MLKPPSLRKQLLAKVPGLTVDTLHTFISKGHIESSAHGTLSFEYTYTLEVILTDYAGHSDVVMIALLQWLRINQPELLLKPEVMAERFTFEVDILNNKTCDIGINLKLTERVGVKHVDGKNIVEHFAEPALIDDTTIDPTWTI